MSRRRPGRTDGQRRAVTELHILARDPATPLTKVVDLGDHTFGGRRLVLLRLHLDTAGIVRSPGGLPLRPDESVVVWVAELFPWVAPHVEVEHERFVGFTHVIAGHALCLYLDPAAEWHPGLGIAGFLNRLWAWLQDAAAALFDPRRALFHPVGGVAVRTPGAPTVVVRHPLARDKPGLVNMTVEQRSPHRLDLRPLPPLGGEAPERCRPTTTIGSIGDSRVVLVGLHGPLSYGPGVTLNELLGRIDKRDHLDAAAVLQALGAAATRNLDGEPLHFLLSIPPGSRDHGVPAHLIAACLPAAAATALADATPGRGLLDRDRAPRAALDAPITWCPVSEERAAVTTRRDSTRPLAALVGARVVIWGCGGLGSWIAEYAARAAAAQIVLADYGDVTGGLLVRQDFTEDEIGINKAHALAARLRALRDDLSVTVVGDAFSTLADELPDVDLIIDATVNTALAAAITTCWVGAHAPVLARVATDRASSTLGLIVITRPGDGQPDPETADRAAEQTVRADPDLEAYRCFWDPVADHDELIPTPGCSVPTFHGAAADLGALAGTMLNLIAAHLRSPEHAGSHLVAMPHTPHPAPPHRWLPHATPESSNKPATGPSDLDPDTESGPTPDTGPITAA